MGATYYAPPALDVSDANAIQSDVKSPKTFYAGQAEKQAGTLPTRELSAGSTTVEEGFYEATTLEAVDADLVTANIKNGETIFGVEGSVDVRNIADADAALADVKEGKTFYASGGAKKTGMLPTKTLSPDSTTVEAGYYAATTLDTVDTDLVAARIKYGSTIFGVEGHINVRNVADADSVEGDVVDGKTFYAVGGGIRTGTLVAHGDLAQDDDDIDHDTGNTQGVANSGGYQTDVGNITTDTDLDSASITCNDPSLAYAVAFASFHSENPSKHQLQLIMGGTVMGTSEYFNSARIDNRSVTGFRAMTGSITCKCRIKVSSGGGHLYYWGKGGLGQRPSMVAVGSVKH
jgi:hypothetical protein